MYVESTFQTVCLLPDTAIPVRLVSISYSNLPQDHIVLKCLKLNSTPCVQCFKLNADIV